MISYKDTLMNTYMPRNDASKLLEDEFQREIKV